MPIPIFPMESDQAPIRLLDREPSAFEANVAAWPVPLTQLVGREQEIETLLALLGEDETRLVTLTGPGGVGKTRLALAAGARLGGGESAAVVFVTLAPLSDPALVPAAIARALDVRESGERPLADQLRLSLRDWPGVLILDNFEQVIAAAPFVSDLLKNCPRIKVLVTSRAVLHLTGEHEVVVQPLAHPPASLSLDEAAQSDAVTLFVQRARAVRPGFTLTVDNVGAVVEICRRLDGLPLALELAAARSKVLSPAALLARLSQRLNLLTSGPQDQPARLQTMRAAIAWSHELLSDADRALLRRLAVFSGDFTLDAAEAIGGSDAFDQVASLLDNSLLQRREGNDDDPRLAMLETVREFCLEQLDAEGETDAIRDRHAVWCQELVDSAWESWVVRQDLGRTIQRLERDHDNLRAALIHLRQKGATDAILRMAGGLFWFWLIGGYVREGRDWLVAALEDSGQEVTPTRARARALLGAGSLAHYMGDEARARPFLQQGLADARRLGDAWLVSHTLINLGIDELDEGRYAQAIPLFDEAANVAQAAGNRVGVAQALSHRAFTYWANGQTHDAETLIQEALAVQRSVGDVWGIGDSLAFLSLVACARGDSARAVGYVEESLNIRLAMGALQYLPWSLENVGLAASTQKRPAEAARLFAAATNLRERFNSPGHEPERGTYLRAVERSRTALGDARFAAEWATGTACTIDESLAEARETIASLRSTEHPPHSVPDPYGFGLTEREIDVLRLLVGGRSDREIGDELFISYRTAQKHVANIFVKLNVTSRTGAVTTAIRTGVVSPDGGKGQLTAQ